MIFLENIESNETISHLNINKGRVENIFYKCKISNGFLIEYKLKKNHNNLSLLLNFLHMPFAFVMFQKGYFPLHGMSFLHKGMSIVLSGTSGSGKSSLSSIFSNTYKIRSEDITCIYNRDNQIFSMPSFPIILAESQYSSHLKSYSAKKISRERLINSIDDFYDDKQYVEVKKIYILEWGKEKKIRKLKNSEALKKLIINSFKPYPFNDCIDSEKIFFKNIAELLKNIEIYLYTRRKSSKLYSDETLMQHIEND